jgi:phage terminase small subunit
LLELAKIALLNPQQVVNLNDATIREDALPEDLAAVASVKVKRFPTKEGEGIIEREIKFYDKSKALELAGKHLGMFRDKVDVNVQTSEKLDDIMSQLGGEGLEE